MFPIDTILSSALTGQPQRLEVTEALAIGAAVRLVASLVESNEAIRARFAKSYGTEAVETIVKLTTHTN